MSMGFAEHRDTEPVYPATSARPRSGVLLLGTVMACFLIGGLTHVHDIVRGGWLPYRFAPDGINLFWSLLSVLDLLVVALLWLQRLSGVLLGLAVMLFDVAVNSYAAYVLGIFPSFLPPRFRRCSWASCWVRRRCCAVISPGADCVLMRLGNLRA